MADDWEKELLGQVQQLKDWEKSTRPPPKPEREANVRGAFSGIITLADKGAATELSRAISAVIELSVEVFRAPAKITALKREAYKMVGLSATFPSWCATDDLRQRAQGEVNHLQSSQRQLDALLSRHEPGTMLKGDLGKQVANELKSLLAHQVQIATLMEVQQKHLVFMACDKARQITQIVGRTSHDYNVDEKYRLLRLHTDALLTLCEQRLDVLQGVAYNSTLRTTLEAALDKLKTHREMLIEATVLRIQKKEDAAQVRETNLILGLLTDIEGVANAMAPKITSDFDHNEKLNEQLGLLRHAVENKDPHSVAQAGKKIVEELDKMKAQAHAPVVDPTDDGSARRALDDAAERLRRLLPGLLGAAKEAMQDPSADHHKAFDAVVREFDQNSKTGQKMSADKDRQFDEIDSCLKKSGLIDAAAAAAKELENLFATD